MKGASEESRVAYNRDIGELRRGARDELEASALHVTRTRVSSVACTRWKIVNSRAAHTFAGAKCELLNTRQFVKVAFEFNSAYTAPPPVAPAILPLERGGNWASQ